MSYNCIRIERERGGFEVACNDPAIQKQNEQRNKGDSCCGADWKDPNVEYTFETKEQVMAFLDKAIDIALPKDEYASEFDKLAKEAQNK